MERNWFRMWELTNLTLVSVYYAYQIVWYIFEIYRPNKKRRYCLLNYNLPILNRYDQIRWLTKCIWDITPHFMCRQWPQVFPMAMGFSVVLFLFYWGLEDLSIVGGAGLNMLHQHCSLPRPWLSSQVCTFSPPISKTAIVLWIKWNSKTTICQSFACHLISLYTECTTKGRVTYCKLLGVADRMKNYQEQVESKELCVFV